MLPYQGDKKLNKPDWKSAEAYTYLKKLRAQDIAWEFLRRNSEYNEAFQASKRLSDAEAKDVARLWGLRYLANPDHCAHDDAVFWLRDACPHVVMLEVNPSSQPSKSLSYAMIMKTHHRYISSDGIDLLFKCFDEWHQIFLKGAVRPEQKLQAIIPLDSLTNERCKAILSFWRGVYQKKPPPKLVETQQRKRLLLILRALDGHLSGASHRLIAQTLFPSAHYDHELWKESYLRAVVRRLLEAGYALMRQGYRKLLYA